MDKGKVKVSYYIEVFLVLMKYYLKDFLVSMKYYIEFFLGFIGALAFNVFCVACVYFLFKGLLL